MLSDTKIKSAKLPAGVAQVDLPDRQGLVLRVSANAKTWVWRYRAVPSGASRRLTVGHYPVIGLSEARKQVGDLIVSRLTARSAGDAFDPLAETQKKTLSPPASGLPGDGRFGSILDLHLDAVTPAHGPKYVAARRAAFGRLPAELLRQPANEVRLRDLSAVVDALHQQAIEAGHKGAMSRVLSAHLKAACRWAVRKGYIETNPAAELASDFVVSDRPLRINSDQLAALWSSLDDVPENQATAARVVILTAQRRGEVAEMRIDDLDLSEGRWVQASNKASREHLVPLTGETVALLRRQIGGRKSGFVFARDTAPGHITGDQLSISVRRAAKRAGIPASMHDFRKLFATVLEDEMEFDISIIARCLNHSIGGVTAKHYSSAKHEKPKRDAFEAWARRVMERVGPGAIQLARRD